MSKPRLLIVEDNEELRSQLKYALRGDYDLSFAGNRIDALALVRDVAPALVTLDLGLPPSPDAAEEGLRTLAEILAVAPATKVIVMTGNADRSNAIRAVQLGAFDYHLKPPELDEFRVVLRRAAYLRELDLDTEKQARDLEASVRFEDIVGSAPGMRDIFTMITRVAKADATVLIQGESGTGKELIARAIHARSRRQARAFVPINCGAIPETLLESELFGHEKGAYTGAHIQRKGKLEIADGGTLFLDEIAEMTPALQVKLLRFLQEREIERIGGRDRIHVDVRIIAATNKPLTIEMQAGRFREDFYYRLSVVTIKVPPLRERTEDVALLANTFLRRNPQAQRQRSRFSEAAVAAMLNHPWPGNIRELENRVARAVILTPGKLIEPDDLELSPVEPTDEAVTLRTARQRAERQALVEVLARHRGNISQAAKDLKVSRPTLHGLLEKHAVNAKEYR